MKLFSTSVLFSAETVGSVIQKDAHFQLITCLVIVWLVQKDAHFQLITCLVIVWLA